MTAVPELITKVDQAIAFGMATPQANRDAVSEALLPLQNYHAEFPFLRVTPNQELADEAGNGLPDAIATGANAQWSLADTIVYARPWAERSPLEREFMTAAGAAGNDYWNLKAVNIWRVSWDVTQDQLTNGASANFLFYLTSKGATSVSYRAIAKLESGSVVPSGFLEGITNQARITGNSTMNPRRYTAYGPAINSLTGSLLIALPAIVTGVHPSDRWGYFDAKAAGVI